MMVTAAGIEKAEARATARLGQSAVKGIVRLGPVKDGRAITMVEKRVQAAGQWCPVPLRRM